MASNGPSKCCVWGAGTTLPRERHRYLKIRRHLTTPKKIIVDQAPIQALRRHICFKLIPGFQPFKTMSATFASVLGFPQPRSSSSVEACKPLKFGQAESSLTLLLMIQYDRLGTQFCSGYLSVFRFCVKLGVVAPVTTAAISFKGMTGPTRLGADVGVRG